MKRLNTKFVIVIVAFLTVALGSVALVYAYNAIRDPMRNVRQGQELERLGDYRGAARAYGRAVAKRGGNIEYMDMMRAATLKIVPDTPEEARQHYETVLALLRQRARPNPSDPEPWKLLLDAVEERARFLQTSGAWQLLYDTARDMHAAVPSGGEAERLAITAKAYATAMGNLDLTQPDREALEADLERVLEADPSNAKAWDAILSLLLQDVSDLFLSNQQLRGQQRLQQFNQALARAREAIPDSPIPLLAEMRRIRDELQRREISVSESRTRIRPILDQLEVAAMAPSATAQLVLQTADQLLAMGDETDTRRAVVILENWLARRPNDIFMKRLLAIAMQSIDLDRAQVVLQSILDAPPQPVSLESAFRDEIRTDAAERIFDIEIARAERAEDPAARARSLDAAKAMRSRIAEIVRNRADEPVLLRADARLALMEGDFITANSRIDRLLEVARSPGADIYLLGAQAALARNELGLSLNYLNRGIENLGAIYGLLLAKARVELALRRGPDAIRTASAILSARPDDEAAARIVADAQALVDAVTLRGRDDPLTQGLLEIERHLADQDLESARRVVQQMMRTMPPDPKILTQAARVEMSAGNGEQAKQLLDQALAMSPNDPYIIQLRAIVEADDPLERAAKLAALTSSDPAQQAVGRYALTAMLIASLQRDIAQGGRGTDGRPRDLNLLRKHLADAQAALPALRDAAMAAAPKDRSVLAARFDEAALSGDLEKALAIGEETEAAGHEMLGMFFQARALTFQRRFDEAIRVLERARAKGIQSAELSRQMAETREAMGMVPEALAAYKDALERRPLDRTVMERYADLLRRSGDVQRALALYRDAAATGTGDRNLLNAWLHMEDLYGDRSTALCWRRRMYREAPSDRENALALAAMLSDGRIDPRLNIDAECRMKLSMSEWEALPPAQKQTEANMFMRANAAEGAEIYRRLLQLNPNDFEVALAQANALARAGRLDEGIKGMRAIIDRVDEQLRGPMLFALGRFLEDQGRPAAAIEALEECRRYQDPVRREADLALSDHWFDRQQWQRAYDLLKPVIDAEGDAVDRNKALRMAEICQRLRRFEEAKALLDIVARREPDRVDGQLELLRGNLEFGLGEDAWARGDRAAAERSFASAKAVFEKVAAHAPGNALPWISLASLHRNAFVRTNNGKELDQALEYIDRALLLAGGYWPAVRLKVDILNDKDDLVASIQTLERYLQVVPGSFEARSMLAQRHIRAGNVTRALSVLADGAAMNPGDPAWHRAIGEIQLARGNLADATRAFDRALEVSPTPQSLTKALEMRVRRSPPDWQGIIDLSRRYTDEVGRASASQAILAAALAQTGDRESGLEALRRAGRQVRSELAAGTATVEDLDIWYRATREVFPRGRTDELDRFVTDLVGGTLGREDRRWLAGLWLELGKDGVEKAKPHLAKAIEALQEGDSRYRARVHLTAGNLAYLEGDCSAAIDAFEVAVTEDPDDSTSLNNLAFLLATCRGEYARALELAHRAVRLNPSNAWFLDTLGYLQLKNGEAESAVVTLTRSVSIEPLAATYLHLAEALQAVGKVVEAREALDKASALKPDNETKAKIDALRRTLG